MRSFIPREQIVNEWRGELDESEQIHSVKTFFRDGSRMLQAALMGQQIVDQTKDMSNVPFLDTFNAHMTDEDIEFFMKRSYRFVAVSAVSYDDRKIVVASNTKPYKNGPRGCSEQGAELIARKNNYKTANGLILVAPGEKDAIESVEGERTPTTQPCIKTCLQFTFPRSTRYHPNMLLLTSNPEQTAAEVLIAGSIHGRLLDGAASTGEVLNNGFNFDEGLALFESKVLTDERTVSVAEFARDCLYDASAM